jgi:rubrerythrin
MDATTKALTDGLLKAIGAEVDGYHFYMMAARTTTDPRGREVFEQLAREEVDHHNFLKAQYRAITETGRVDVSVKLGSRVNLTGTHPIFSPDLKERAKSVNYEMSALSIGSQLELSAVQFYSAEAAKAADPAVKRFYEELAVWEQGHYEALNRQLETLRGEHWDTMRFSPF